MNADKQTIESIRGAAAALDDRSVDAIDFDRLREMLTEYADLLESHAGTLAGFELLRRDYIDRIAVMARAVAAVSRRQDNAAAAGDYIDRLADLDASRLVEQYRLVSARFRDAFPTSFGGLGAPRTVRRGDPTEHQ